MSPPVGATVISTPEAFHEESLYIDLEDALGCRLLLKVEGMNLAGSVKLKAASEMVDAAEDGGRLRPGSTIVESSSGNLGVALAMIAANRGYRFVCVTDQRCNLATRQVMEAFGAEVHMVNDPDPVRGFLGARLDHVAELCASDERVVWLNQYANPDNWGAHYRRTAPAIARDVPDVDVLFVGAGTCGTLMGCARWFREQSPRRVRVVAVDAVGSVTFGGAPATRLVPGLGSGVPSQVLDRDYVDEVVHVAEADTVATCHRLAAKGFLLGGSTGTVVSAAARWLEEHGTPGLRAVAIAPDLGERYLDTVYQPSWVQALFAVPQQRQDSGSTVR